MPDSTAEQTASNSQPQGTSEKSDNAVLSPSKLSRRKKIILGIATFGLIFGIGIFFLILLIAQNVIAGGIWGGLYLKAALAYPMLIFYFFTLILSIPIVIIYLFNVIKNKRIPKAENFFWAVVFFHGFLFPIGVWRIYPDINVVIFFAIPYIAMSIYWYRYIWEGTRLNHLIKSRYWYIYVLIVLCLVIYLIPVEVSILSELFKQICQYNLCINW